MNLVKRTNETYAMWMDVVGATKRIRKEWHDSVQNKDDFDFDLCGRLGESLAKQSSAHKALMKLHNETLNAISVEIGLLSGLSVDWSEQ